MIFNVMRHPLAAAAAAFSLVAQSLPSPAAAAIGEWVEGSRARIRLVADAPSPGKAEAAIEIQLDDGWKTYWRSPGDAGIPPAADFSASQNVAPPALAFPVPTRVDDGFVASNVYFGEVALPVTLTLLDPARPARLALKLDLGVCEEVCVPEHFEAALDIAPGEDKAAARIVAAARSRLPAPPEPGIFSVGAVRRSGGTDKRPVFELDLRAPDPKATEVFVEGPADWYPSVPTFVGASGAVLTYKVDFDRLTARTPISGSSLRVTVISGGKAVEQSVRLD
jgi:suppressor for copper-sensitivity B